MCELASIRPGLRFLLITGHPGSGKSTLARQLYCRLPERWRLLSLDDFFGLVHAVRGDQPFWEAVARHTWIPATAIRHYTRRRARLLIEGIVRTESELSDLCTAARLDPDSPACEILVLHSSKEEMVRRKSAMDLGESRAQDLRRLHDAHAGAIDLPGAAVLETDGRTPEEVLELALAHLRSPRRPARRRGERAAAPGRETRPVPSDTENGPRRRLPAARPRTPG
jgi:energy-coupling factor transporter ATP-binding protein EcfA2